MMNSQPAMPKRQLTHVILSMLVFFVGSLHLNLSAQEQTLDDHIKFSAEFQIEKGSNQGVLLLTVDIADGNYIYALEQPDKDVRPSKINVTESDSFSLSHFVPDQKPIVVKNDPTLNVDLAKHKGKIVFWAPFKLADNQSIDVLKIDLSFNGSVCSEKGMCFPIRDQPVRVAFGGYYDKKEQKNR